MAIGDNIRTMRKQKGMTQKQLADACGMVDSTLRTYELGNANPKPAAVAKIAKALDVSIEELYGVEWINATAVAKDSSDISAMYRSLLSDNGGAIPIDNPSKTRLMVTFDRLNKDGQKEAIKRIEELSMIPAYQLQPPKPNIFKCLTKEEQKELEIALCGLHNAEYEEDLLNLKFSQELDSVDQKKETSFKFEKAENTAEITEFKQNIANIFLAVLKRNKEEAEDVAVKRDILSRALLEKYTCLNLYSTELCDRVFSFDSTCIEITLKDKKDDKKTWVCWYFLLQKFDDTRSIQKAFEGMIDFADNICYKVSIILDSLDAYNEFYSYVMDCEAQFDMSDRPFPEVNISMLFYNEKENCLEEKIIFDEWYSQNP